MSVTASADPTRASLWTGRIFTGLVAALALAGLVDGMWGGGLAGRLFIAAGAVYMLGATVLYLRRDYILRLFGYAWPLILPRLDELQLAHRQRAFSATFAVFVSVFSLLFGVHLGAMLAQYWDGEAVVGFLPTDPVQLALIFAFALLALSIAPQAYLAWTLKPLDAEDAA